MREDSHPVQDPLLYAFIVAMESEKIVEKMHQFGKTKRIFSLDG